MTKNCNKKKRITQSRFTHFFCIGRISVSNHEHIKEVFRWKGVRANFDLTVWLKLVKCRCLFAQESRRLAPRPKKVPHPPTDRICEFIHPPVSQLLIHSRIWNWHLILIDGNLQLEHVSLCTQSFQRYIMDLNVVPCHFCCFFSGWKQIQPFLFSLSRLVSGFPGGSNPSLTDGLVLCHLSLFRGGRHHLQQETVSFDNQPEVLRCIKPPI